MRVVYARTQFCFDLKAGGSVGHTLGVLSGFKKNGCSLKVISNEPFIGIDEFENSIIWPKMKKPNWVGEFFYNLYASHKVKKEILGFKPDFIYHRYTGYTFFVAKLAKELNIPLILEFNSFDTWKIKHWIKSKNFLKHAFHQCVNYEIVKHIEGYNLQTTGLIVVVSQALKDDLINMGIAEDKILFVPNGIDPDVFNPEAADNEKTRKDLNIENNKLIVGFSGTFGPWHGIPQLTEAIDIILGERLISNIHFLIMGEGQLWKQMARKLSKYRDITFTGIIPYSEIQDYLAVCEILVSPHNPPVDGKEFFGSPTKLFEYMSMGKGIVASNLGQIGQVLKDNQNAILVAPGDVTGLVEGILRLAEDEGLRERLGKNAREDVIANYTWKNNVERVIDRLKML